jgi:hypothetical protein
VLELEVAADDALEAEPLVDFDEDADEELEPEVDAELEVVLTTVLVDVLVAVVVDVTTAVEAVEMLPVPPETWKVGE